MAKPIRREYIYGVYLGLMAMVLLFGRVEANGAQPQPQLSGMLQELLNTSPGFAAETFKDQNGRTLKYRLLEPLDYKSPTTYPLVIFLGGTGERGADNIRQLKYAGPFFSDPQNRRNYPCFVVIPQCPLNQNWVLRESNTGTLPLAPEAAEPAQLTLELLFDMEKRYKIDLNRIYLMGISSGASGVWDLASRYPHLFAAAVPFAGSGDINQAQHLYRLPIWIFHGELDILVSTKCSRLMYQALVNAGGHPRFTQYPLTSHMCWIKAFKDPELLHWLFAQHRL